jgi:rRNA maturation endonuclease Nob1
MTKKKSLQKKESPRKRVKAEKRTIRCRNCFMVDSYTEDEKYCRHCGAKLFPMDSV